MTIEEFKKHCIDEILDQIKWADLSQQDEYEKAVSFIDGLDFAASCFLAIRQNTEWAKIKQILRQMIREARRNAKKAKTSKTA